MSFYDRITKLINNSEVSINAIEACLETEFQQASRLEDSYRITHLIHFVSIMKTRECSNFIFALQVYTATAPVFSVFSILYIIYKVISPCVSILNSPVSI